MSGRLSLNIVKFAPEPGKRVAATSTGASVTLPTMLNGVLPAYVYLVASSGPTDDNVRGDIVTVSPEVGAVAGSIINGLPLVVGSAGIILNVKGYTHIGYDYQGAGTDAYLWLAAVESQ